MTPPGDGWQEFKSQWIYARLMATGALSLAKLLLTSAGDVRRLGHTGPTEEHYTRPPRLYELPPYVAGMRVGASDEKYLRPTRYCNPRAPEVVALAHALGAYHLPDREFVQAAFAFAKEKLLLEIMPIDGVEETLRRGTGTCFHLISAFIALCRAAGIRARYKIFAMNMIQTWREALIDPDPLVKKWYDALGYFMLEGEGEAFVDGQWTVAHVGPTAERQAAAGLPITRFGEDAIGIWFILQPGTVMRLESLPRGLGPGTRILHRLAPGSMERVNVSVQHQTARGVEVLAAAGGQQAYDAQVRAAQGPISPEVQLKPHGSIVFTD